MSFQTRMQYENGKLVHFSDHPEYDKATLMQIVSVTGAIDLAIQTFVKPGVINGTIYVESRARANRQDGESENEVVIDYDITPSEALPAVEKAVALFYRGK